MKNVQVEMFYLAHAFNSFYDPSVCFATESDAENYLMAEWNCDVMSNDNDYIVVTGEEVIQGNYKASLEF